MRILLLISSLKGGGAERATVGLARWWANQRHNVRVVTLEPSATDFYELDARVERGELCLAGVSPNPIAALWNNAKRIAAIRRELVGFQPQIAIGVMTGANVLLRVAAAGLRIVTVGCERTHPPFTPLGSLREISRKLTYPGLNSVVALTQESANWLRERTRATTTVIPNAARWPMPSGRPVLSVDVARRPGRKMLLGVGRLGPEKQFEHLLLAFCAVSEEFRDWDVAILGEGVQRAALQQKVVELKLDGRVFLPGAAGNLADWYSAASLFVLTSKFEGFPNVLLEAMAHGVPSVSYDCDTGPRDIIRNGIDGLLIPPSDQAALERALRLLMGDDALRGSLSQAATEVRHRFSEQSVMALWDSLFRDLGVFAPAATTLA